MRLLIAVMEHETNTFSPVPTPLLRFGGGSPPPRGAEAIAACRGAGTAAGPISTLPKRRADVVFPSPPTHGRAVLKTRLRGDRRRHLQRGEQGQLRRHHAGVQAPW
jgi:hypothetical protein